MLDVERLSPVSNDVLAVCAASFLYGDALIVGAGRCVAAKAALLHPEISTLTILDRNPECKAFVPFGAAFICADALSYNPGKLFESVYLDTYPNGDHYRDISVRVMAWLLPHGRLICADVLFPPSIFDGLGRIEARVPCGPPHEPQEGISVYRRIV